MSGVNELKMISLTCVFFQESHFLILNVFHVTLVGDQHFACVVFGQRMLCLNWNSLVITAERM